MLDWLEVRLQSTQIDETVIVVRLLLTLFLGGIIGLERESKQQPAGLRTHILISLGAAMLMMLSIFIPQHFGATRLQPGDPSRIAAQVVSGVGFLGAGAIFRLGTNVKGLTTAASIWVVAAIGLLIGSGLYIGALIGTAIVLFSLVILEKVENYFYPDYLLKTLQLEFFTNHIPIAQVKAILESHNIRIQSTNMLQCISENRIKIKFYVHLPKGSDLKELYEHLQILDHLHEVVLDEKF